MPQKYTEKKKISNQKWDAANLDRIGVSVRKGRKAELQAHAAAHGESLNAFIGRAIDETVERDNRRKQQTEIHQN